MKPFGVKPPPPMVPPLGRVFAAAVVTGLATSLGALPFLFVRALPRRIYDGILGLGAGLMLSAATLGLLSEALAAVGHPGAPGRAGRLAQVVFGFVLGVVVAALMDRFIPHRHAGDHHSHLGHEPGHDHHDRHEHTEERRRSYAVIGAMSIHRVPEGLAIGAGFAVSGSAQLGWLLALVVAVQNTCEGIVMAAPLRQSGVSPWRGLAVVTMVGLCTPIAALAGFELADAATRAMPLLLAFAGGILIYVTSNEIIPESHSHGHEGTASAGIVAGFLVTMLLEVWLH